MAIRCVVLDPDLDPATITVPGVQVVVAPASALDRGAWEPFEVLVVSADPEVLAVAGERGHHRLVAAGPEATALAVAELCRELDRA